MTINLPNVDAKASWERRKPLYNDIDELITTGYLTCPVDINGVNLSMRSLVLGDHRLLTGRVGMRATNRSWKEWAIASTTWMVDGHVLHGYPNAAVQVRTHLRELPDVALDALFSVYTGLFNRMTEAVNRVEAFCYEDYSRAMWRMSNRGHSQINAVPGVNMWGVNPVQRVWTAYNVAEDDRDRWNLEWSAARFVASAHNPKGVKRITQRDESDRNMEEERRQRVIAGMYYRVTGRHVDEGDGMVVRRAVTREELVEEMNRWLRGEKDFHDEMIDAYKESIRVKQEHDRTRHEERMVSVTEMDGDSPVSGGVRVAGLTREELLEFVGDRGLTRNTSSVPMSSNAARLYDKYVAEDITVGGLGTDGKAVPVNSGEPSLDEQVSGRRVVVRTEGED